jgi:hypothetical protein
MFHPRNAFIFFKKLPKFQFLRRRGWKIIEKSPKPTKTRAIYQIKSDFSEPTNNEASTQSHFLPEDFIDT